MFILAKCITNVKLNDQYFVLNIQHIKELIKIERNLLNITLKYIHDLIKNLSAQDSSF